MIVCQFFIFVNKIVTSMSLILNQCRYFINTNMDSLVKFDNFIDPSKRGIVKQFEKQLDFNEVIKSMRRQ